MLKVTLRELINGKDEWVCNHMLFVDAYRSGFKGFYPFAELHIHKNQRPIEIAVKDILKIEILDKQYKPL